MPWRARWAAAQVTPVLFSSLVWLVVSGLIPGVLLAGLVAFAVFLVAARMSRAMLWLRFGVRPATAVERDALLAALVPIAWLRGRGQPRVGVGLKGRALHVLGPDHLLVSRALLADASTGVVRAEQVSAATSFGLGQAAPACSGLVRAVELYCSPWWVVEWVAQVVSGLAAYVPLVRFAWAIRPVVFVLAAVHAYSTGPDVWRQVVAAAVVVILALTYTTPWLRRRWTGRLQELGDARVAADGMGGTWAVMLGGASTDRATIRRIEWLTAAGVNTRPIIGRT